MPCHATLKLTSKELGSRRGVQVSVKQLTKPKNKSDFSVRIIIICCLYLSFQILNKKSHCIISSFCIRIVYAGQTSKETVEHKITMEVEKVHRGFK